ncbi:MAG: dihydropteroate synthase [Bacteroidota bacterium]|jgi:dihydropteroate synthase
MKGNLANSINCGNKLISLEHPIAMGILNTTPDSFYDGGKFNEELAFIKRFEQMLDEGAMIIDIGGASSRPGAATLTTDEEISRTVPFIKSAIKQFPDAVISIDTYNSTVAKEAVYAGASIINDISGGTLDDKMFDTVAELKVPYILMHMKGSPENMKDLVTYDNLTLEIYQYFQSKIIALQNLGVKDIILDPGFGFAKNIEQNFILLKNLNIFKNLRLPILAGLSRKSMIYKSLGITAAESLNGTTALNMISLMNGANILRVHDVKEAVQTIQLYKRYNGLTN